MQKLIVIAGSVLMLSAGIAEAQDTTLGGTSAALGGGATLDAGSNGSMSNAMSRARSAGGSNSSTDSGADDFGGRSMGGGGEGDEGHSGAGATSPGGATGQAAAPKQEPMLYGGETGESLLSELMRGSGSAPRRATFSAGHAAPGA